MAGSKNWNKFKIGDRVVRDPSASAPLPSCDSAPGVVTSWVSDKCGTGSRQKLVVRHDSGIEDTCDVDWYMFETKRAQGPGTGPGPGIGTAVAVGLSAVGVVGLGMWMMMRDGAPRYWRDGLPVRAGDCFRRDPIYDDSGVYEVIEVSPDVVRFRGRNYPYGTISAWSSDFFSENGLASNGRGPNQGNWTRVP